MRLDELSPAPGTTHKRKRVAVGMAVGTALVQGGATKVRNHARATEKCAPDLKVGSCQ